MIRLALNESISSFQRNGGFDRAAALAYYCFLSIIPLLLLEVLLATRVIRSSVKAIELLQEVTGSLFPLQDELIMNEVYKLSLQKSWGILTVILLIWSATPLASGLRGAFQAIFKPAQAMNFVKAKILDVVAILTTLGVLVATALVWVTYSAALKPLFSSGAIGVIMIVQNMTPFLATTLFMMLFYRLFVPVKLKMKYLVGGSVLTAVLLSAVGPLFTFVLKYNPDYGVTFGSLKAVFLLFVWIYYSFIVILLGTEIMANMLRRESLIIRGLFTQAELTAGSRKLLNRFMSAFDDGQTVFSEGDEGTTMFHVLSGAVTLKQGETAVRVMKPGEYFGEIAMLLGSRRTMSAVASAPDTQLVAISRANLDVVLRENPEIVLSILQEMAARLKATNEKLIP